MAVAVPFAEAALGGFVSDTPIVIGPENVAVGMPEMTQFEPLVVTERPAGSAVIITHVYESVPPVTGTECEKPASVSPPAASNMNVPPLSEIAGSMVSEAVVLVATAGEVAVAASPVSVAETLIESGLFVASAAVGVPIRMQFDPEAITDNPVPAGSPVMEQFVIGGMPFIVGTVKVYAAPASPAPGENVGTVSAALIVSAVEALIPVTGGVLVAASPVSVAEILIESGAAASADVGDPERTQFGEAVEAANPVPAGNPDTLQFVIGSIPPVVGIVML